MSKVTFVDLPERPPRPRWEETWGELLKHPGQWAEWWTENQLSAYSAARAAGRNGHKFESRVVDGKAYVRAVPK